MINENGNGILLLKPTICSTFYFVGPDGSGKTYLRSFFSFDDSHRITFLSKTGKANLCWTHHGECGLGGGGCNSYRRVDGIAIVLNMTSQTLREDIEAYFKDVFGDSNRYGVLLFLVLTHLDKKENRTMSREEVATLWKTLWAAETRVKSGCLPHWEVSSITEENVLNWYEFVLSCMSTTAPGHHWGYRRKLYNRYKNCKVCLWDLSGQDKIWETLKLSHFASLTWINKNDRECVKFRKKVGPERQLFWQSFWSLPMELQYVIYGFVYNLEDNLE